MFILYAKVATSLILCCWIGLLLWQRKAISGYFTKTATAPWIAIFYVVLRLLPVFLVYIVLGYMPQSDVAGYYYPIANTARQFGIMYRDVYCPYSPFFGYWLSLCLHLWNDVRAIMFLMTLIEIGAVYVTYRIYTEPGHGRPGHGRPGQTGEGLFKALFYLSLPLPFVMCVFSGQEDVGLWLLALWAIWIWQKHQSPFWGGVLLALGLLSTKAVFVFLIFPIFLMTPHRQKVPLMAGLAALGLPVLAFLLWKTGLLFIEQPLDEGEYLKAPNWRSVLNPIIYPLIPKGGGVWKWIMIGLTLVVITVAGLKAYGRRLTSVLPLFFMVAFGCMTLFQQNAVSNYAYLFMLPLVYTLTNFKRPVATWLLVVFNLLAAIHPSLWWRLGQPYYKGLSMFRAWPFLLEYGIELALFVGFGFYTYLGFNRISSTRRQLDGQDERMTPQLV